LLIMLYNNNMNVLIVDNGTSYLQSIKKLVKKHNISIVNYSSIPLNTSGFDLIILSGGHTVEIIKENEYLLRKEIELIKTTQIPLIGICYGCELIAFTFSCTLEKLQKTKGVKSITKLADHMLFEGINELFVFENHEYYIKELSGRIVGLARTDNGYEIIKHKDKKQYGFQFHPEMLTESTSGDELFNNCIRLLNAT
jgi:GMP synthase (glutamine-hydrolysing)